MLVKAEIRYNTKVLENGTVVDSNTLVFVKGEQGEVGRNKFNDSFERGITLSCVLFLREHVIIGQDVKEIVINNKLFQVERITRVANNRVMLDLSEQKG